MRLKSTTRRASVLTVAGLLLVASISPHAGAPSASAPAAATESVALAGLPLDFVENRGQWDGPSSFVARQGPVAAFIEPGAVRMAIAAEQPADVRLTFDGADKDAAVAGEHPRDGRYNFFVGNESREMAVGRARLRRRFAIAASTTTSTSASCSGTDASPTTSCLRLAPTSARSSSGPKAHQR